MDNFCINIVAFFMLFMYIGLTPCSAAEVVSYRHSKLQKYSNSSSIRRKRAVHSSLTTNDERNALMLSAALTFMSFAAPTKRKKRACQISVKHLFINHALIIDPSDHSKFLYPDDHGMINFDEDEPVFLSCGTFTENYFVKVPGKRYQTFFCVNGAIFQDGIMPHNFYQLYCQTYPKHRINSRGQTSEYFIYEIGFDTEISLGNNFLKLIDVYRVNKDGWNTIYVKSKVSKALKGGQDTNVKVRFNSKYCCEIGYTSMDAAFNEDAQEGSFRNQLKSHKFGTPKEHLITKGTDDIFERCHLTPAISMVYSAAALATYTTYNVVSIWKGINKGNWASIENHVKQMAITLQKDLFVYTGVHGQLQLKDTHDNNKMKDIFLSVGVVREVSRNRFPISSHIFKVVVEPESRRGVVFVVVNNPYVDVKLIDEICEDAVVTGRTGIALPANWKPQQADYGFSYMCTVQNFLKTVKYLNNDPMISSVQELLYIPK